MTTRLQFRRDSAANWTSANPVLAQGEPALENDTKKTKLGDGVTAWNSLAYQPDSVSLAATYVPLPTAGTTPGTVVTVGSDGTSITYATPPATGASIDDGAAATTKVWSSSKVSGALAGKASPADISTAISNLVGAAPAALDTLKEIADQIAADEGSAASLAALVALKAPTNSVGLVFKPEAYADLSNTSTIAGPAIQAAIDAAAAAGGGTVKLGSRIYKMGTTTLVIPAAHYYVLSGGVQVDLVGAGRHNTRLQWDTDLGAGKYAISCGDPTATFANSLGRYAQGVPGSFVGNFTDFAMEGPGSGTITSTTLGAISTQMSGIAWGARRSMKNVYIRGFYTGLDIVGDNATFENVDSGDCYYGAYWNQQSTYYYGDLIFTKCLFGHGTMAAIGLHPLSQGIKGTVFDGCYFSGSPYGIFLESDSVTSFPYLTGDVIFDNCMFEGIGNAMFYDDNVTPGSLGGGVAKGILGGVQWRNSLFGWQSNQLLTAGGRTRIAMIVVGQMATCVFNGIRNQQQWVPGDSALWQANQFKGAKIIANMDSIWSVVAASGKPFVKSPGGGGFSANTIEFENPGYYRGTFLPQINGGTSIAVGNLVERNGNRFDRADASSTNPIFGVALAATTGGTSQVMTPVATSGEQITVTLSGSGLANSFLKKGTAGVATAATGPSDGQVVGWLKSSSGTTGTMSMLSSGSPGAAGTNGTNGQGFLFRGAWAASTAYALYDVVTNGGNTYVVTTAHTSPGSFTTTNLSLWAAKGTDGTNGTNGTNGSNGTGYAYRGAWTASTAYAVNDVLTNAGTTYLVTTAHTSPGSFTTANLSVWAAKGDPGAAGTSGSSDAALHGLLAISAVPSNALGTVAPVVGRTGYVKIPVAGGTVINNIVLDIATAGAAVTAYLGVYDKSGNLLAQTADFGSSTTATVNVTVPLTSAATVPTGDTYVFVGLLISAATTAPVIRGAANGMAGTATNFALTGALGLRSFYVTASGQTSLPSTVLVATGTAGGGLYLIGLK